MKESDKKDMNEYYTSYRTALIVCIIIFVAYLSGILAATINTSKKGLSVDSPKEELDEEDNLFIPLYTGFVTFVVIATISLSHFKKKGTSGYYDMKASEKGGVENKIKRHGADYKNHLQNIGGMDPISNAESLDEKFYLKMPYYDSLVIVCLGLLLSSFFGIFLFKRTLFCKRQCYAGKPNRCCSTHLMCPNKSNSVESQLSAEFNLNLNFDKGNDNDQLITIDRGLIKQSQKENFPNFMVDIRRGSSSGMTNILNHPEPKMYGCCCSSLTGVSGVSFYIPENVPEGNYGNITNLLVECIGNTTHDGLCNSVTVAKHTKKTEFYVNVDSDVDPTGFFIGYEKGTDTFIDSSAGISTNNPNGIVENLKKTQIKFGINQPNTTETKNLFPEFANRHIQLNNLEKKSTGFTTDFVCIDPGFRYIDCSQVTPVPIEDYDKLGPSARYYNTGPNGIQYFPACFDYSGSNSQINATNTGNNNFETLAARVFPDQATFNDQKNNPNKSQKGDYTSYVVGYEAIKKGGTELTTYNYDNNTGKYKKGTSQSTSSFTGSDAISISTHSQSYTDSATFCFRKIDTGTCYDPLYNNPFGNPGNNNIASESGPHGTTNPDYYKTHAPNAFRSGESANSKTTKFHTLFIFYNTFNICWFMKKC